VYRDSIKSDKQKDFRGVANQKVSVGFMTAGPPLAAAETKRSQHSVRFIRAESLTGKQKIRVLVSNE
jgi:hypothetical protein